MDMDMDFQDDIFHTGTKSSKNTGRRRGRRNTLSENESSFNEKTVVKQETSSKQDNPSPEEMEKVFNKHGLRSNPAKVQALPIEKRYEIFGDLNVKADKNTLDTIRKISRSVSLNRRKKKGISYEKIPQVKNMVIVQTMFKILETSLRERYGDNWEDSMEDVYGPSDLYNWLEDALIIVHNEASEESH